RLMGLKSRKVRVRRPRHFGLEGQCAPGSPNRTDRDSADPGSLDIREHAPKTASYQKRQKVTLECVWNHRRRYPEPMEPCLRKQQLLNRHSIHPASGPDSKDCGLWGKCD